MIKLKLGFIRYYDIFGSFLLFSYIKCTKKLIDFRSCSASRSCFYKKPRVIGSGSAFLRITEFESQKFLRSIKILVFSFLIFSYFEPLIFLKFYTKNTFWTIISWFLVKRVVILHQMLMKLVSNWVICLFSAWYFLKFLVSTVFWASLFS